MGRPGGVFDQNLGARLWPGFGGLILIEASKDLCDRVDAKVEKAVALNSKGRRLAINLPIAVQNLFGKQAVFVLRKR